MVNASPQREISAVRPSWIRQDHVDVSAFWKHVSFHLVSAFDVVTDVGWRIDLSQQPYGEIWLIRDGSCAVSLQGREWCLEPGDIGILSPGSRRITQCVGETPLSLVGIAFTASFFDSLDIISSFKLPVRVEKPSKQLKRFLELTVMESGAASPESMLRSQAFAQLTFAEVLASLARAPQGEFPQLALRNTRNIPQYVTQALEVIAARYQGAVTVAEVSQSVHVSPKHFSRGFKRTLGVTPSRFITLYRLRKAAEDLLATDLDIKIVAFQNGFRDAAYFSRAFKEQYGSSPRTFRERTHTASV
jgi:AraC-like DNA-binding protein